MLKLDELLPIEPRLETTKPQQLGVAAALDDPSHFDDQDLIRRQDRAQTVGDRNRGPTRHEPLERRLDQTLGSTSVTSRPSLDGDPGVDYRG